MRTISKRHSPVADESNSKNFLRWKLCLNLFSVTKDSLQVEFKKKIWEGVFIFGFICVPFVNTTPAQEVHNHEHKQEFNPKYTIDVTYEAYIETDQKWRQKGYHPKSISTALDRQGQTRYTGLWNFDATISESISSLRLPENEFKKTCADLTEQGFLLLDMSVELQDTVRLYNSIWIKTTLPKEFHIHERMSHSNLENKLREYAKEGYGIVRIIPFTEDDQTWYAAAWIRDRLGYKVAIGLTEVGYLDVNQLAREEGFTAIEIAWSDNHGEDFFGVWVNDSQILDSKSHVGLTKNQIQKLDQLYRQDGYTFEVVDAYRPHNRNAHYSAIWHLRAGKSTTAIEAP